MDIYYTIFYSSCFIWLFPPIKQRKTEYFIFFLILALADPIGMGLHRLFSLSTVLYTLIVLNALISSLLLPRDRIFSLSLGTIVVLFVVIYAPNRETQYVLICLFLLIIITLLAIKFLKRMRKSGFNLFLSLLIFYNIVSFFRMLALVLSVKQGAISFIMGYAFQIVFGIIFTFINIKTKNFKLNIR